MSALQPAQSTPDNPEQQRAWLASILLRSQQTWFGRFALHLRRLASMGRGQRRRLERKAAVSLAGAALVLSLGAGLMRPPAVYAASINVDGTAGIGAVLVANDGECSLPEAIINANNDSQIFGGAGECAAGAGASDTINLPPFTFFTLPSVYSYQFYSDTGLPSIDTNIIIEGNNSTIVRESAVPTPEFRIMAVSATGRLTLNDASILSGYSDEDGGGLYNGGGYALLQNVTFAGNYAVDDGGAIENDEGGTMIIDGGSIDLNDAGDRGGGVSTESGAILTIRNNAQVTGNYAYDLGGGLAADESGLVTIDDSTISGNSANYFGGGIATYKTEIVIQNNTIISDNYAGRYGGGADFYLSTVSITDSTITGNDSVFGVGLRLAGSLVNIENSLIGDNNAPKDVFSFGGGILNEPAYDSEELEDVYSQLTIIESTVSGNGAVVGGGIANRYGSRVEVVQSTIDGNTAVYGGGLLNVGGTWAIINSTLSGNVADAGIADPVGFGGAIFNISNPSYDPFGTALVLSTVTGNSAKEAGGGIHNAIGQVFVAGSIVSGNTADAGSEIYNSEDSGVSYSIYSILGHNGETTAQALYNHLPAPSDLVLTSDGVLPTALSDILDTTLADNGGPTETHALVASSPAIDLVPFCGPDTPFGDLSYDQRSRPRNINIPGIGSDPDSLCDVGAYEVQLPSVNMCPVDDPNVGTELTEAIGVGQGSPTKGIRTRKLVVPNSDDVVALYGQLAAVDVGLMKYVRFLPQGYPKIQLQAPTSAAYRPFAVDWWGTDLPTDASSVKGQFFWGVKGNKAPRAFVLWPTYETNEAHANVFATFDNSSENHVAWEPAFIPTQTQTLEIPPTQFEGADVTVTVALVDVNKDDRPVILTVEAGGVTVQRTITEPNRGQSLNLEEIVLENVAAGADEVVITLESPSPSIDFPDGGDSAAMIGATANYVCEEGEAPPPAPRPDSAETNQSAESASFWNRLRQRAASMTIAPAGDWQASDAASQFLPQLKQPSQEGRNHGWANSDNGRD